MAKAEWVNLSQESGTGSASVAVSSKAPYTGRKARETTLTWVAVGAEPVERTVIQAGAMASIKIPEGKEVHTTTAVARIHGVSNEAGLKFSQSKVGTLPLTLASTIWVAGKDIEVKEDEMFWIEGDPGEHSEYAFLLSLYLTPPEGGRPSTTISRQLVITGFSGTQTTVTVYYHYGAEPYIEINTGTEDGVIRLDANGTPVTVEVYSNTDWEIA